MTKKISKTDVVLNKAETLLRDIEAASRGVRLRKAEAQVRAAASTPSARRSRLHKAESEVVASAPRDPRLMWNDMTPARAKPVAKLEPPRTAKPKAVINRAELRRR